LKIISPPNSDEIVNFCNVAILVQLSADFALAYNFQDTHGRIARSFLR